MNVFKSNFVWLGGQMWKVLLVHMLTGIVILMQMHPGEQWAILFQVWSVWKDKEHFDGKFSSTLNKAAFKQIMVSLARKKAAKLLS